MAIRIKNINLLPWRAAQRRQQYQQLFILIVCSLVLVIVGLFLWRSLLVKNIQQVKQYNQQLQKQITQLQYQADSLPTTEIHSKVPSINLTKFLSLLPGLIPQGIYLTQIKKTAESVDLYGSAQAYNTILMFLQHMQQAGWKTQIKSMHKQLFHVQIVGF